MPRENAVVREGIAAGLIGATAIAVWFAILDLSRGAPLETPVLLGNAVGSLFLPDAPSRAGAFLGYTLFHFSAFAVIGILLSWAVNSAERAPWVLIGPLMLLVAFEIGWIGFTQVLSGGFGNLSWLQVFVANLIGVLAMGVYLWRQHPNLTTRVGRVIANEPEKSV
jgi:hypothetical protein